jgi:hypothetical protein
MSQSKPVKSEDGSVNIVHESGKTTPFAELNEVEKVEAIVSDIKNVSTAKELEEHKSVWDMDDSTVQDVLGSAGEFVVALEEAKAELSKLPESMQDINNKLLNEISKKTSMDLFGMSKRLYGDKGARTVDDVLAKFDTVNISEEAKKQLGKYLKAEHNAMKKRVALMSKTVRTAELKKSVSQPTIVINAEGKYQEKDKKKFAKANKLISFGIEGSSYKYAQDNKELTNVGSYSSSDIVGVSINGSTRKNWQQNFNETLKEVAKAIEAGATVVADNEYDRNRKHNKETEGTFALYMVGQDYAETSKGSGVWKPKKKEPIRKAEVKKDKAYHENRITDIEATLAKSGKAPTPAQLGAISESKVSLEDINKEVKSESFDITPDISEPIKDIRSKATYTEPKHNGFGKIFTSEGINDVIDFVKTFNKSYDNSIFLRKANIKESELAQRHGDTVELFEAFNDKFNTIFYTTKGTNPFVNANGEVNAPVMAQLFADKVINTDGKTTFGYSKDFTQYAMMIAMEKIVNGTPIGSTDSSMEWLESHFEGDKKGVREAVRFGGIPLVSSAHAIGRDVMKAAGYKLSDDMNYRDVVHAEEEIGNAAILSLYELGLLEYKNARTMVDGKEKALGLYRIPSKNVQKFTERKETVIGTDTKLKEVHSFVSPIADALNVYDRPVPKFTELGEKVKLREDIQGHDLTINEVQKAALESQNSRKFTLNSSMFSFFDGKEYTDDEVASILGLPSQEEIDNTNINWRDNLISTRNAGLLSFRNSIEFFQSANELGEDGVWQYEHFFTISGRSMTNSAGGADYQNDKAFSRFMVDTDAYKGTVTKDNQAVFKFGVLQSLEHYAEDVIGKEFKAPDKATAEVNAKNFLLLVNHIKNEKNKVGSTIHIVKNPTKYSQDKVAKAISDIGNIHGLRGLTSLLESIDNIDTKGNVSKSFETNIILETDGVTNGLSHLMWQSMMFADKSDLKKTGKMMEMAARIGLYPTKKNKNGKNQTYQQWKSEGHDDTYEMIAKIVDATIKAKSTGVRNRLAIAVIADVKRKIAKNPVMVFQYGSSAGNIAKKIGELYTQTMFEQFVDNKSFVKELESVVEFNMGGKEALNQKTIDGIKSVIKKMNETKSKAEGLELELKDSEMEALVDLFSKAVGQKFGEVMSNKFNEILSYQDAAMKSVEIGRRLLSENADYKDAVAVINDKASTVAQVKEAKKKMLEIAPKYQNASGYVNGTHTHDQPVVQIDSAYTKDDKKRKMNVDGKELQYHTKLYEIPVGGSNTKEYSATKLGDKKWAVVGIHNIDGTIMFDVLNNTNLLQVFDAILTGVNGAVEGSEIYNKSYMNINTGYNLIASIRNGLADYINANPQSLDGLTLGYKLSGLHEDEINELQDRFDKSFLNSEEKVLKVPAGEFIKYLDEILEEGKDNVKLFSQRIKSIGQMSGLDNGSFYPTKFDSVKYAENSDNVIHNTVETDMDYTDDTTDEELGTDREAVSSNIKKTFELQHDANALTNVFNYLGKYYGNASNKSELLSVIQEVSSVLGQPIKDTIEKILIVKGDKQSHGKVNIVTGDITIAPTKSMLSTSSMTAQESFAHELVHKATEYALRGSMELKMRGDKLLRDLIKVMSYEDYKKNVMVGRINSMIDEVEAKKRYDYITSSPSEMIAFAKTNKGFSDYLATLNVQKEELGFVARIAQMVEDVIAFVLSGFKKSKETGNMKKDINSLVVDLYKMNQRYQNEESIRNAYGKDNIVDEMMDKFDSKIVEQSNALLKKAMDGTVDLRARLAALRENNLVKKLVENKLVSSLKVELAGHSTSVKAIIDLMRVKENNQSKYNNYRKALKENILLSLNGIEADEEVALQSIIVDADIAILNMTPTQIAELLDDDKKLDEAINEIEKQLYLMAKGEGQKKFIHYARNQAEGLGYYLATNIIGIPHGQMFNAKNIASGKYVNGSFKVVNGVESSIDKLATLYALKYENRLTKDIASKYIKSNEEGVKEVIGEYAYIKKYSQKALFDDVGQSHLVIKGYSYEKFDASIDMTVVDSDKVEATIRKGYKVVGKTMPTTMVEDSKPRYIMSRPNIETRYSEGLMDVTQMKHKSSEVVRDENIMNANMDYQMEGKIKIGGHTGQFLAPLMSPLKNQGIVGYRYMASKSMKANILNQDRKISTGLSEYHSITYRKVEGLAINRSVVKALIDDMDNVKTEPNKFVDIDFNDDKVQAMYSIMPPLTRKFLKNALKGHDNVLKVRKEILDQVFGYKNFSVTQLDFFKDKEKLKWLVGISEKIWMDISSHVRESIVFKTLDVVLDNLISNVIMLSVYGMNPVDIIKGMNEGRLLMNQYRTDMKEKNMLELRQKRGLSYDAVKLARLRYAVNTNKVKVLVDSGQFQSIIDETEVEYDDSTNIVESFGSKQLSKLPAPIRNTIDFLYMDKNTKIFQFFMKFVQYSDFVGKYAYYKHATEKKGMSKSDAIDQVEEMFINYSLLQHKALKYGNDMSPLRFMKYLLRVQRVIARMATKKTSRAGAEVLTQQFFGDIADPIDSLLPFVHPRRFAPNPVDTVSDLFKPHLVEGAEDAVGMFPFM